MEEVGVPTNMRRVCFYNYAVETQLEKNSTLPKVAIDRAVNVYT